MGLVIEYKSPSSHAVSSVTHRTAKRSELTPANRLFLKSLGFKLKNDKTQIYSLLGRHR